MGRLEASYKKYLSDITETETPLTKEEFLFRLKSDSKFSGLYGKKTTKLLGLDERLEIAYPDREERMMTLIFMGTKNTKALLNKIKIPTRKLLAKEKEIEYFLNS